MKFKIPAFLFVVFTAFVYFMFFSNDIDQNKVHSGSSLIELQATLVASDDNELVPREKKSQVKESITGLNDNSNEISDAVGLENDVELVLIPQGPEALVVQEVVEDEAIPDVFKNSALARDLQVEFKNEKADGQWSYTTEQEYMELIQSKESLADYVLKEAECRENSCKLSFLISGPEQQEQLAQDLIQTLLDEKKFTSLMFSEFSEDGIAQFYLTNEFNY